MASQQRGRRPASQRGDFTGNQKTVLAEQHAAALEERREEIGLITAGQAAIKDEGVIDLTKDGGPTLEHPDLNEADASEVIVVDDASGVPTPELREDPALQGTVLDGGGKSTIEVVELPPENVRAAVGKGEALTQDMLNEPVVVRALYDLEDVTIGYGNTYNLREGYRYKVPRWVAMHLEEKDLCLVLSLATA